MPSPLGHALGGFAAGWLIAGPPEPADPSLRSPAAQRRAVVFAALGMAADLDLLIGRHSQFTHSIGMALAVGAFAFTILRARRPAPGTQRGTSHPSPEIQHLVVLSIAAAAAYASHVLLDWLAADATPPLGITALWPFSSAYYLSGLDIFWGISREPWRTGAAWHDVLAVGREIVFLAPVALGAWWLRRSRAAGWQNPHAMPPGKQQRLQSATGLRLDSESLDGR